LDVEKGLDSPPCVCRGKKRIGGAGEAESEFEWTCGKGGSEGRSSERGSHT